MLCFRYPDPQKGRGKLDQTRNILGVIKRRGTTFARGKMTPLRGPKRTSDEAVVFAPDYAAVLWKRGLSVGSIMQHRKAMAGALYPPIEHLDLRESCTGF